MKSVAISSVLCASLKEYLHALRESGVDGIPVSMTGKMSGVTKSGLPLMPETQDHENSVVVHNPESLEIIRKSLGECQRCRLGKCRKHLVFGVGNPHARVVFIGDGPGADGDRIGQPLAGEAGQVLNRLITAMELKREDVYICNVVKCRPPENRNPESDEIEACAPFLLRQIQSIHPEVIVGLGNFACQTLLGAKEPISKLRGKLRDFQGFPFMPTHHPSSLIRNKVDSGPFWEVWDDMVQVLQLLNLPVPKKNRKK